MNAKAVGNTRERLAGWEGNAAPQQAQVMTLYRAQDDRGKNSTGLFPILHNVAIFTDRDFALCDVCHSRWCCSA
jgi:hypothetical protein